MPEAVPVPGHATRVADRSRQALVAVRAVVASMLMIHGLARAGLGIVDDFGSFFEALGLPFGFAFAWLITVVEIGGGGMLLVGKQVRVLSAWFAIQLTAGIVLIHGREGWFVVGAGRNGMEYSVLLVILLVVVGWAWRPPARTS